MRTDKYYSASEKVAALGGYTDVRYKVEGGRYILSESDIRNMVIGGKISPSDFRSLDIVEVSAAEARRLIAENGHAIGGAGGIEPTDEEAAVAAAEEPAEETEGEPKEKED